jgi:hypothetical protein
MIVKSNRIKGDELLPSWDPPFPFSGGLRPPELPPVFVIVSDIRDSEIQDRKRVLYSYSYMRGSYEIEADLTNAIIAARDTRRRRPPIACSASQLYVVSIFPNTMTAFFLMSDLVII